MQTLLGASQPDEARPPPQRIRLAHLASPQECLQLNIDPLTQDSEKGMPT